jgi:hypothetical protein
VYARSEPHQQTQSKQLVPFIGLSLTQDFPRPAVAGQDSPRSSLSLALGHKHHSNCCSFPGVPTQAALNSLQIRFKT